MVVDDVFDYDPPCVCFYVTFSHPNATTKHIKQTFTKKVKRILQEEGHVEDLFRTTVMEENQGSHSYLINYHLAMYEKWMRECKDNVKAPLRVKLKCSFLSSNNDMSYIQQLARLLASCIDRESINKYPLEAEFDSLSLTTSRAIF